MSARIRHAVSQELIAAQDGKFFARLTELCTDLKSAVDANEAERAVEILKRISPSIREYTGLKVAFHMDSNANAFMAISVVSDTHPIVRRGTVVNANKELQNAKGLVMDIDHKRGFVSGELADSVPAILGIGLPLIFLMTPEELAAAILHEVGHLYTYCAMLAHGTVSNMAMAMAADAFQKTEVKSERLKVIKDIERALDTRFKSPDLLAEGDAKTLCGVISASSTDNLRKAAGTRYYDMRLNESLADLFASRHGAGRYIVSGLMALNKHSAGHPQYRSSAENLSLSCMFLLTSISVATFLSAGLIVVTGGALTASALGSSLAFDFALSNVFTFGMAMRYGFNDVYDDPIGRYQAIRRDIITRVKDRSISKEQRKDLLEQIDYIDSVIEPMTKGVKSVVTFSSMGRSIAAYLSGRNNEFKLNRELETLANNDLYVAAARLAT